MLLLLVKFLLHKPTFSCMWPSRQDTMLTMITYLPNRDAVRFNFLICKFNNIKYVSIILLLIIHIWHQVINLNINWLITYFFHSILFIDHFIFLYIIMYHFNLWFIYLFILLRMLASFIFFVLFFLGEGHLFEFVNIWKINIIFSYILHTIILLHFSYICFYFNLWWSCALFGSCEFIFFYFN